MRSFHPAISKNQRWAVVLPQRCIQKRMSLLRGSMSGRGGGCAMWRTASTAEVIANQAYNPTTPRARTPHSDECQCHTHFCSVLLSLPSTREPIRKGKQRFCLGDEDRCPRPFIDQVWGFVGLQKDEILLRRRFFGRSHEATSRKNCRKPDPCSARLSSCKGKGVNSASDIT